MIKVKILNMKSFLKVVNQCVGRIMVVSPDGKRTDINGCTESACPLLWNLTIRQIILQLYRTMPETVKSPAYCLFFLSEETLCQQSDPDGRIVRPLLFRHLIQHVVQLMHQFTKLSDHRFGKLSIMRITTSQVSSNSISAA